MKTTTYKPRTFRGPAYVGSRGELPHAITITCSRVHDDPLYAYRAQAKLDGYNVGYLHIKKSGEIETVRVTNKKLYRRRVARAMKDAMQKTLDDQKIAITIFHSELLTDMGAAWASSETGVEYEIVQAA